MQAWENQWRGGKWIPLARMARPLRPQFVPKRVEQLVPQAELPGMTFQDRVTYTRRSSSRRA